MASSQSASSAPRESRSSGSPPALIRVIGVGGAGCNAVDRMIEAGLQGVEFFGANTDKQALSRCTAAHKIQLGPGVTSGLGAGGDPEIGAHASEESRADIKSAIEG